MGTIRPAPQASRAVSQALDYGSTRRAVMVCVGGWLFAIAFVFLFGALFTARLS